MHPDPILDFRSDTVTTPTPGMRQAMAEARVGDDVFGEDPTVTELEQRVADLFGRQAALFVPSGTMVNLIAMALHCRRGDEILLERRTHSFFHEAGGGAALLGAMFQQLDSESGWLTADQVEPFIRPADVHEPVSRLVIVENTANLCGGKVVPLAHIQALRRLTRRHDMRLHLDGARIWNAAIRSGVSLPAYAAEADTLGCCLSKGLGCPVGSLLVGDEADMARARWLRKMFGGGMRQAGILAAAGLVALEHHLPRLGEDHTLATELARALRQVLPHPLEVQEPETNMVVVHTDCKQTTDLTVARWCELGVLCFAVSPTAIRLVTHRDLPDNAVEQTVQRIQTA